MRPQGHIVFIDGPVDALDITVFNLKSVTLSWELLSTRSVFQTDDMSEQGQLPSTVAGLLDENIQAMQIKQESGTMMGKQVLIL